LTGYRFESFPSSQTSSNSLSNSLSNFNGGGLAVTEAPKFKAGDYLPGDLFSASSSVPYLSESEYESYREQIRGQQRAIEIAQENLKLSRQILKSKGLAIDCEIEVSNNRIKLQDLTTTNVKLSQAQVKTSIEQAKLSELNHDLQGYTEQASLKQQTWNLKIEGLRHEIEVATHLLDEKRKAFQAQLSYSR
jgi:hypothetical protein